ncbi:hypothetical protein NM688_g5393 [Phlebia brevispora]|uniref:Uncharacterized protein n=1 Tax=Phlebia brevispora TaxID=194682 RepID=A0ACC1SW14_9APHY|nr:hypothetical protein NM688_g5393 [Phlebia brevispora]
MSALPPKAEDSVFAVQSSIVIDAPVDKVWSVLLDFPAYSEWNAFVRSQTVVDSAEQPLEEQTVKEGSFLYLTANIPPSMDAKSRPSSTRLVVSHLDPENHRVAWTNRMPAWIMTTERWQWLTAPEDGKTKYETIEVFNGFLAYLVKWFVGSGLRQGFQAMADGLKAHSEQ